MATGTAYPGTTTDLRPYTWTPPEPTTTMTTPTGTADPTPGKTTPTSTTSLATNARRRTGGRHTAGTAMPEREAVWGWNLRQGVLKLPSPPPSSSHRFKGRRHFRPLRVLGQVEHQEWPQHLALN